ncbi:hypothetical protein MTR67_050786 [Solanum verrucosum]|uniref:F-box domain-containing protein n=1 Tax=Solanum verrucosum TaxID=315347 RepID=A0AAF0V631_SOLVR|nr:hypothetical protein MTR67_050786 [Solanum verrucosum]
MADWSKLPNDVIAHIANHIKVIEDFIAFGAVCTSWRIAATKDNFDVLSPQVPLLMLQGVHHEEYYQNIYSLSKKKVSPIFLPQVRGNRWGCIDIAVVSANANPFLTSDYVLMDHHNGADSFLAFWRPGDLDWTHIDVVNHAAVITSLVYHKGEFYSMSYSGKVRAYEIAGSNVKTRLVGEIDEFACN